MDIRERVNYFSTLFDALQATNSMIVKNKLVSEIPDELQEDFKYIVECLNGKRPFGFKYPYSINAETYDRWKDIKSMLVFLHRPLEHKNLSYENIVYHVNHTAMYQDFLRPIVNRTLKLGIGNSILDKDIYSPMLAKKYDGRVKFDSEYFITEKLDGNRCIAYHDDEGWHFKSRNGKDMHVNFDMSGFDESFIYDGEVLSRHQTINSMIRTDYVKTNTHKYGYLFPSNFNTTSGMINSHSENKDLIYNIFDIVDDSNAYNYRRMILRSQTPESRSVRILPVLGISNFENLNKEIHRIFEIVDSTGGEGLMINYGNRVYERKRTDALLKVKATQTIDMKVVGLTDGKGKYDGLIGALICRVDTDDGKIIECEVGSGLTDALRLKWTLEPSKIIGSIVEVEYFDLSQDKESKGTNIYSLRFPRFKQIRNDKNTTSEY